MNKKAQSPEGIIYGIVMGVFLLIFASAVFTMLSNLNCQNEKIQIDKLTSSNNELINSNNELTQKNNILTNQLNQCVSDYNNLIPVKDRLNLTESQLNQCLYNYNDLITYNITKKDFTELNNNFNITRNEFYNFKNDFDIYEEKTITQIDNLYFSLTVTVAISISLIIFFFTDIVLFSFFEIDIKKKVIQWIHSNIIKKLKRKKEE